MKYDLSKEFERNKALTYMTSLIAKDAKIELKEFKPKRTLPQNSYFHACCKLLSEYSGYTIPETKIIIKDQLEFMHYQKGGHKFYRSSADLDKMEFIELIEFTRSFGDQHGVYIPTSEEYLLHQFEL